MQESGANKKNRNSKKGGKKSATEKAQFTSPTNSNESTIIKEPIKFVLQEATIFDDCLDERNKVRSKENGTENAELANMLKCEDFVNRVSSKICDTLMNNDTLSNCFLMQCL